MKMRLWEKFVSLAALSVIVGGAACAYGRERLANADLNPVFDQINQQYFDGGLSGVRVEWQKLDGRLGEAQKLGEHDYRIWIDRRENTSIADVRNTLQHEACHVFVDWQELEEHGAMFRECVLRFVVKDR
jgi:SprT-like family